MIDNKIIIKIFALAIILLAASVAYFFFKNKTELINTAIAFIAAFAISIVILMLEPKEK